MASSFSIKRNNSTILTLEACAYKDLNALKEHGISIINALSKEYPGITFSFCEEVEQEEPTEKRFIKRMVKGVTEVFHELSIESYNDVFDMNEEAFALLDKFQSLDSENTYFVTVR